MVEKSAIFFEILKLYVMDEMKTRRVGKVLKQLKILKNVLEDIAQEEEQEYIPCKCDINSLNESAMSIAVAIEELENLI